MVILQADGYPEYHEGAIVKIFFKNFLTYDDVICEPGSKLNVIIGPNGTGKSTIICGICLALGGHPKVLGRSDNIGDFIKHGKDSGSVEVYIKDSKLRIGYRRFRIQINHPNKPAYYIDDKKVSSVEVQRYADEYNIQVTNPCTFLAQDKVKSFSEQGPKVLLQNTEKAGPSDLLKKHKELIEFSKSGEKEGKLNQEDQERLNIVLKNLKTKKARAENYAEMEKLKNKVQLYKKKLSIMHYEQALSQSNAKKTEFEEADRQYKESTSQLQPLRDQIDEIKDACTSFERLISETRRRRTDYHNKMEELLNKSDLRQQLEKNSKEYNATKQRHANWDAEYQAYKKELNTFRETYKAMEEEIRATEDPTLQQKKQELLDRDSAIQRERSNLNRTLENYNVQMDDILRKKRAQEGIFVQKLHKLNDQNQHSRIQDAWEYYNANREKFRYEVFVPYLSIYVKNADNLKYLNNLISYRDLSMFIFGCREDEELLLGDGNPYRINSTIVDAELMQNLNNIMPMPENLKRIGFKMMANDLFDAPGPVRSFLLAINNLDKIPIGGAEVDDKAEEISGILGRAYTLFLSERSRIMTSYSKYSDASYVRKSQLRLNGFLIDKHAIPYVDFDSELHQLQAKIDSFPPEFVRLDSQAKSLYEEKQVIGAKLAKQQEKRDNLISLQNRIDSFERKLKNKEQDKPDIEAAKAAFQERQQKCKDEALKNIETLNRYSENLRASIAEGLIAILELDRKRAKISAIEDKLEELKQGTENLEFIRETKKVENERAKQALQNRVDELKRVVGIQTTNLRNLQGEEKTQWKKLNQEFTENQVPTILEKIEDLIGQEEVRLEGSQLEGTQKDVDDYEKLQAEAEKLKSNIEKREKDKVNWEKKMQTKLQEWKEPLERLVGSVSEHYSNFFKQIGCIAYVLLDKPENEFDIENYGIKIMVKFRNNNSVRQLDHQVQSGGERSVSTMLYLMALQEQCPVPFRCVDEINQGMDPTNERRVFDMMVKLLSGEGQLSKTQYFLLTPKLLSGLTFNEKVTVLCVHNGPTMKNAQSWDVDKFLKSKNLL